MEGYTLWKMANQQPCYRSQIQRRKNPSTLPRWIPNIQTVFIGEFIDAMDLGMSYERVQGLQSNIGIVDSEKVTTNGMEFEYSLGKNTEIRT